MSWPCSLRQGGAEGSVPGAGAMPVVVTLVSLGWLSSVRVRGAVWRGLAWTEGRASEGRAGWRSHIACAGRDQCPQVCVEGEHHAAERPCALQSPWHTKVSHGPCLLLTWTPGLQPGRQVSSAHNQGSEHSDHTAAPSLSAFACVATAQPCRAPRAQLLPEAPSEL